MQKFKINGQSVPKTEWKQTDGRTEVTALPPTLMRSVMMQFDRPHSTSCQQSVSNNVMFPWSESRKCTYGDDDDDDELTFGVQIDTDEH